VGGLVGDAAMACNGWVHLTLIIMCLSMLLHQHQGVDASITVIQPLEPSESQMPSDDPLLIWMTMLPPSSSSWPSPLSRSLMDSLVTRVNVLHIHMSAPSVSSDRRDSSSLGSVDDTVSIQFEQWLYQWYNENQQFVSCSLYLAGEGLSTIYLPSIVLGLQT
jgi:hypothetical protein